MVTPTALRCGVSVHVTLGLSLDSPAPPSSQEPSEQKVSRSSAPSSPSLPPGSSFIASAPPGEGGDHSFLAAFLETIHPRVLLLFFLRREKEAK